MAYPVFSYIGAVFFFNDTATTEIYTLSLHDALPIYQAGELCSEAVGRLRRSGLGPHTHQGLLRSEEHTSELQSRPHLVCRLLLEKKKGRQQWRDAAGHNH